MRSLFPLVFLAACMAAPAAETRDAAPRPDAPASPPECEELAPGAPACCDVFCTDPDAFDAQCAPAGVCITWVCPLVSGGLIDPEACSPTPPAPVSCRRNRRAPRGPLTPDC